jgi:hypothetical protein
MALRVPSLRHSFRFSTRHFVPGYHMPPLRGWSAVVAGPLSSHDAAVGSAIWRDLAVGGCFSDFLSIGRSYTIALIS